MEKWQRHHIENCTNLNSLTTYDVRLGQLLLSCKVINKEEVQQLKMVSQRSKDEAVNHLFEIIVTRVNGYAALIHALYHTDQSGSFIALIEGVLQHLGREMKNLFAESVLEDIRNETVTSKNLWGALKDRFHPIMTQDNEWYDFLVALERINWNMPSVTSNTRSATGTTQKDSKLLEITENHTNSEVDTSLKRVHDGERCEVLEGFQRDNGNIQVAVKIFKKVDNSAGLYKLELDNWLAVDGQSENVRHIVRLYEYGSLGLNDYTFTMEWAKADLQKRIIELKQDSGNHHDKVVGYLRDVAEALHYLHTRLYIHRDVKPKNILIFDCIPDKNGKIEIAKLGDFGVSLKEIPGAESLACGTPEYMPPESNFWLSYGVEFENTWRVDIFSFGVTCHFAMSMGEHPFGQDTDQILQNIENLSVKPVQLNGSVTDYLCANHLFAWMMTKPVAYEEEGFPNRPEINQVIRHPFFLTIEEKLKFIREATDTLAMDFSEGTSLDLIQPGSCTIEFRKTLDEKLYELLCCQKEEPPQG